MFVIVFKYSTFVRWNFIQYLTVAIYSLLLYVAFIYVRCFIRENVDVFRVFRSFFGQYTPGPRLNEHVGGIVLTITPFGLSASQVCQERGWKEYEGTKSGDSEWSMPADEYWNLWWKSTGFPLSHYKQQKIWQVCTKFVLSVVRTRTTLTAAETV